MINDRVGMGWRPELAGGIFSNLDRIDVLEVIAEDYYADSARMRALKTLARQAPVVLHGVSLGMASTAPVDRKRLEKMARLVEKVQPESWSEHLAFVRAGDIEIGHLAAPPRTAATIEGTAANLATAQAVVGSLPLMENIATLIDPPASDRDEAMWIRETLACTQAGLLLDLHNLYANAINFGLDPQDLLARMPVERVHTVHISGGKWIGNGASNGMRLLDDHLHDPPDPVYDLLTALAARCPNSLTVVLERDGAYPPMEQLLAQLDRLRRALQRGRAQFVESAEAAPRLAAPGEAARVSNIDHFLATIYVDPAARARFLSAPGAEAARAGLPEEECRKLEKIDRIGLEMAARSFARKRTGKTAAGAAGHTGWRHLQEAWRGLTAGF